MNKFPFMLLAILLFLLANTSSVNAKQKKQNFKIFASPDFSVQYSPSVTVEEVNETVALFQQSFSKLNDEFSFKSAQKPSIVLHGTVLDFINATGNPGWHGGVAQGNTITLEPPSILKEKSALKTTIFHESAHYFISSVTHGNCPAWLQEGFAAYFSGESSGVKFQKLTAISSFNELSAIIKKRGNRQTTREHYAQCAFIVRAMVNKVGIKNFLALFMELGNGKSFSSACQKIYGMPERKLFNLLKKKSD